MHTSHAVCLQIKRGHWLFSWRSWQPKLLGGPVLRAGAYLALTAVLGGLLFVQPEGYEEAVRDVIRLSPDADVLKGQQGYITCDPLDPTEGGPMEPLPLHCSLAVIPAKVSAQLLPCCSHASLLLGGQRARIGCHRSTWLCEGRACMQVTHSFSEAHPYLVQVNSEFQAFKHIQIIAPGEMARATKPLEATLALQPTLILTNSLPCSLDVVIWQVGYLTFQHFQTTDALISTPMSGMRL